LKREGHLIIGLVDKCSLVGKQYLEHQHENIFYREANFLSTQEVFEFLQQTGFKVIKTYQTILDSLVK